VTEPAEPAAPAAAPLPEIEPRAAAPARLQGRVESIDWEQDEATSEPHLIAVVRADDGARTAVDLGALHEAADLRLREGALISVVGSFRQFAGESVLVADAVAEIAIIDRQPEE
jgi:hypothetical protein